jgi:hypothetical protein
MSERRVFDDAYNQYDAVTMVLAEDPYVVHVVERIDAGVEIDHPVTNWREEMLQHLEEKYDVTRNLAHGAISKCRADYMQRSRMETGVDQA